MQHCHSTAPRCAACAATQAYPMQAPACGHAPYQQGAVAPGYVPGYGAMPYGCYPPPYGERSPCSAGGSACMVVWLYGSASIASAQDAAA